MDKYVSAEIVCKILEDKKTDLEAIVRCYDFGPRVREVSPLYQMFTHNNTELIVSYDLFKMYIAIIFYLKTQLSKDEHTKDLERIEYDLGYAQYHLMKKFEQNEIDELKYEEEVCHAYEKAILKYLFLIQVKAAAQDKQLAAIKNAVLGMNDETLVKLGFVNRLSNFKRAVHGPFEKKMVERLEYYSVDITNV
tara:strand:- start:242 stop:820 length:579 start_codon:yes stop_codon:yes gene_type:complete